MILAGDIGGTNTRLAVVQRQNDGTPRIVAERKFPSREYKGLDCIVTEFLEWNAERPQAACFGVAGPVQNGRCATMNLTWVVDQRDLERATGIPRVAVINDLEANAHGIGCLQPADIVMINAGDPQASGNACVVSPGTGLGEAGMYWDGSRYHPIATEGGHTDFAPRNALELELTEYLLGKYDHLSYERVVSGPGLVNIFDFLRETGRGEAEPEVLAAMEESDAAAAISSAAMAGRSPLCEQALDLFLELFGAEAGNVALNFMATGGVWLGGGIVIKVLPRLRANGRFLDGFTHKGRLEGLMRRIPIHAILNEKTALLGAAHWAFELLGTER